MRREPGRLETGTFDMVVVGGGIQGAWVALRAAEAGYAVALIERDDFAAATSSNSLNILHGGLRYLQHLDLARMRASIRARREFCRRSPHLVQPLRCILPLAPAGIRSPWFLGPALAANDVISMDRNRGVAYEARLPRGGLIGGEACRQALAPLVSNCAFAGAVWWDALALDPARLALEPVIAAARAGAIVANRMEALEYLVQGDAIAGVTVRDCLADRTFDVRARVVINATGPWAGQLAVASGLMRAYVPAGWIGGLNVVLSRSLGIDTAVALSSVSKGGDRTAVLRKATRELFFVPWHGVTVVGTDYHRLGAPADGFDGPPASAVADFVAEIAQVAPRAGVVADDVAMVQWGVLPMDSEAADLPCKSPVLAAGQSETGARGLVVVIGEKLTSAPDLSRKVLQRAIVELGRSASRGSGVRSAPPDATQPAQWAVPEIDHAVRERLTARYGQHWAEVAGCVGNCPGLMQQISAGAPVLGVEIVHGIREEMALSLDDLVLRRLGLGQTRHPGHELLQRCALIAATELNWDPVETQRQVLATDEALRRRVGRPFRWGHPIRSSDNEQCKIVRGHQT